MNCLALTSKWKKTQKNFQRREMNRRGKGKKVSLLKLKYRAQKKTQWQLEKETKMWHVALKVVSQYLADVQYEVQCPKNRTYKQTF